MPMVQAAAGTPEGLAQVTYKGDKFQFLHVQNVDPTMKHAQKLRKAENNGWTDDRSMRLVAKIPELVFFANPQLVEPSGRINRAELRKFLRSPMGERFRTVDKGI